ncbi:MAG: caspase family protein, partial [Verrucomicrobiota bacterium]
MKTGRAYSFAIQLVQTALLFILSSLASFGQENGRFALVIGNNSYQTIQSFKNPANDADLIAGELEGNGFTVTKALNADTVKMRGLIEGFCKILPEGSIALVYFAGHGFQFNGQNYLLPIDFSLGDNNQISPEIVTLNEVLNLMHDSENGPRLKIVVLDCCRNDPLFEEKTPVNSRSGHSGQINAGLAVPARTPPATILCFATDPGAVAFDGNGRNSPYTISLSKHLFTAGVEVNEALRRVGQNVQ